MPNSVHTIAAVEGGGTSFVVSVAEVKAGGTTTTEINTKPKIIYRQEIDSSHDNPSQTLKECAAFFTNHRPNDGYSALGIAMFGPVGLDKSTKNKNYGRILSTSPKASWRNVDFLTPLQQACDTSCIALDTDVNAPALAEYIATPSDKNISSLAYITVGTGIGVGLVVNNATVHGRMHPEGGHVAIQTLEGDTFGGYSWGTKSPYQGKGTVEGITSSVALTERLEMMTSSKQDSRHCLADLPDDHEIWDHAANALANLCCTLILTLSIEKIVLGGGVMKRNGLIEKVRQRTLELINGYLELPAPASSKAMADFISLSQFGSNVGLVGAIVLAQKALLLEQRDPDLEAKKSKQEAYGIGLRHGFVVGVTTALVVLRIVTTRMNKKR